MAAVLDRMRVFDAILWLGSRRARATRLPILTYHSIQEIGRAYPFDVGVVDASPAAFERQMEYVARFFESITADELRERRLDRALPGGSIMITFDDGYRDNLHVAVPILKRHGLRATFFIATSPITERRLFWWDKISYLIKRSQRDRAILSYPRDLDLRLRPDPTPAIRVLLKIVKDTHGLDIERFLAEIGGATGVSLDRDAERALADELLLTWDEVRALRAAGMDVQSHTSTHRVLNTLSTEEARRELVESRETLERELGTPVRAISYPCGYSIDGDGRLRTEVGEAGYELGFRTVGPLSNLREGDALLLQMRRMSVDYDTPMSWFRGMLAVPRLTFD
jgi:peptidoglycan/xylan/chitin deacetylase (PgdA/CDA1 family)